MQHQRFNQALVRSSALDRLQDLPLEDFKALYPENIEGIPLWELLMVYEIADFSELDHKRRSIVDRSIQAALQVKRDEGMERFCPANSCIIQTPPAYREVVRRVLTLRWRQP